MAEFQLVGSPEPFLLARLKRGEKIFCESDAMVTMEPNLVIGGQLRGGLFQSFMRKFTTGESLFQQEIKAANGDGECLLSPISGDMKVLKVDQAHQYILSDGSFLAATETVQVKAKVQTNLGGAIFGDTGGFVVMETGGYGDLCISGSGTLMELDIDTTQSGGEYIVDNGHCVAWTNTLSYTIGLPTSNGGFLGGLLGSVTSGEGMVLKFRGKGTVVVCSRNSKSYLTWLVAALGLNNSNRG
ncbi:TIGR00266 family protein [Acinetobacter sp. P1(2025)]|uniref:TIGR00266 family protein n=1 Tax=Acinetobacter sp. P1(2025) TaxID=3446120 RepID=UPI003F52A58E